VDEAGPEKDQVPGDRDRPGPEGLLEVGYVAKPHGLRGDVVVALSTNRVERVAPGSVLVTRDGTELTVARSSAHKGRFIVQFESVDGIDAASALEDPDALWVHDLVGADVVDVSGEVLGRVESVQANPASDLLVLSGGGLIPLRFVVDHEPGVRVVVDAPDGILDLG